MSKEILNTVVNPTQRNIFIKKGVESDIDFLYMFPTKYYDFREVYDVITEELNEKYICLRGIVESISRNDIYKITTLELKVERSDYPVRITFFASSSYQYDKLCSFKYIYTYVCGQLKLKTYRKYDGTVMKYYEIANPIAFSNTKKACSKIMATYPKHKGMTEAYKEKILYTALTSVPVSETLPKSLRDKYELVDKNAAIYELHHPHSMNNVQMALNRILCDDLLYFFCKMYEEERNSQKNTVFKLEHSTVMDKVLKLLPYDLTSDQFKVLAELKYKATSGERLNALVQGDVGCGKSIIAFILMLLFAENHYQSVLLAPTLVLAEQHFTQLNELAKNFGFKVGFLSSSLKAAEKKKLLKEIKEGTIDMIVGTHSVISNEVEFSNLALCVIDEEHRLGVKQRELLAQKSTTGVHTISFSATPIPRSLAKTIYGSTDIYEVKTMPAGRKAIKTKVISEEFLALNMAEKVIKDGSQVYVVCPAIDSNSEESCIRTVKNTAKIYEQRLNIPVGVITGKESKSSVLETLEKFKDGSLKVLIATTIVEVGVNVPNATLITINDAYMFGLATLHQLRGRVGRGNKQGYCLLLSEKETERLKVLENTNDGFEIAKQDLAFRKMGNLIGSEQSGNHRFYKELLANPELTQKSKLLAQEIVNSNMQSTIYEDFEKRSEKIYLDIGNTKIYSDKKAE